MFVHIDAHHQPALLEHIRYSIQHAILLTKSLAEHAILEGLTDTNAQTTNMSSEERMQQPDVELSIDLSQWTIINDDFILFHDDFTHLRDSLLQQLTSADPCYLYMRYKLNERWQLMATDISIKLQSEEMSDNLRSFFLITEVRQYTCDNYTDGETQPTLVMTPTSAHLHSYPVYLQLQQ